MSRHDPIPRPVRLLLNDFGKRHRYTDPVSGRELTGMAALARQLGYADRTPVQRWFCGLVGDGDPDRRTTPDRERRVALYALVATHDPALATVIERRSGTPGREMQDARELLSARGFPELRPDYPSVSPRRGRVGEAV